MTGSRAGDVHRRVGGDAAGVLGILDDLPFAIDATDLDHGAAMGGDLDVHQVPGHLREVDVLGILDADAREHQLLVGVFVVGHEQAVVARAVDRHIADEIGVVAELARLAFGRLACGVEFRRVGEQRIAPAQEHLGVVALGHVMGLVDAGFDFLEVE